MFNLRRILRFLLLCYAVYTFVNGVWSIILAEDAHDFAEDAVTIRERGTAIFESRSCDGIANDLYCTRSANGSRCCL